MFSFSIVEDLTGNGRHKGMLALMKLDGTTNATMRQTSLGLPSAPAGQAKGESKHSIIYISSVELSYPVGRRQDNGKADEAFRSSLYKKVIATTSNGMKFVWMDETVSPPLIGPARPYGRSSQCSPMHWGQEQWEKRFGKREL
jgi:hypothetical protein